MRGSTSGLCPECGAPNETLGEDAQPSIRSQPKADHAVILFDGVCNLCNGLVRSVIRRDPPPGLFRFAALQSPAGQRLLREYGLPTTDLNTFVLIDGGQAYTRSAAALRTLRRLGLPWSLLFVFIVIPRPLRDLVYRFIARHRYRWFGRREVCMTPTDDVVSRFVSD